MWNIPQYSKRIKISRDNLKLIAYCPVDGLICDDKLITDLDKLDGLVVYNNYAYNQIKDKYNKPLFIVPHCVNNGFYVKKGRVNSFLNRAEDKQKVFGDQIQSNYSFVILNANRNSHRKRIDLTIKAFELFANNKNDVFLCLHSEISESPFYMNLTNEVKQKIIFPFGVNNGHRLTISELNSLYNACDVGVNTSMGEGWGLISIEHAFTGAVQIVPDHSAGNDLWNSYGLLLKSQICPSLNPVSMSVVDVNDLVIHLNQLYSNKKYLNEQSQKCLDRATLLKKETNSYHTLWLNVFDSV